MWLLLALTTSLVGADVWCDNKVSLCHICHWYKPCQAECLMIGSRDKDLRLQSERFRTMQYFYEVVQEAAHMDETPVKYSNNLKIKKSGCIPETVAFLQQNKLEFCAKIETVKSTE